MTICNLTTATTSKKQLHSYLKEILQKSLQSLQGDWRPLGSPPSSLFSSLLHGLYAASAEISTKSTRWLKTPRVAPLKSIFFSSPWLRCTAFLPSFVFNIGSPLCDSPYAKKTWGLKPCQRTQALHYHQMNIGGANVHNFHLPIQTCHHNRPDIFFLCFFCICVERDKNHKSCLIHQEM